MQSSAGPRRIPIYLREQEPGHDKDVDEAQHSEGYTHPYEQEDLIPKRHPVDTATKPIGRLVDTLRWIIAHRCLTVLIGR